MPQNKIVKLEQHRHHRPSKLPNPQALDKLSINKAATPLDLHISLRPTLYSQDPDFQQSSSKMLSLLSYDIQVLYFQCFNIPTHRLGYCQCDYLVPHKIDHHCQFIAYPECKKSDAS